MPVRTSARGGVDVELRALGALTPVSRAGGQGRVYAPDAGARLASVALVVKLYRRRPVADSGVTLAEMVGWGRGLAVEERRRLYRLCAWPLATVSSEEQLTGILMQDLRERFELPFVMPSGRVSPVMLQLEHLLGADDYLQQRGRPQLLDTRLRAALAERIADAFAFLHARSVVVSDVSPSNLLIALGSAGPEVALIDCDSMVFRGSQALASVETADWQLPARFREPPLTRAADSYKLGLIVLRVFARSSDARELADHRAHVPAGLHGMLERALSPEPENRPGARAWEMALRRARADEHLMRRHPGPRPPLRPLRRRLSYEAPGAHAARSRRTRSMGAAVAPRPARAGGGGGLAGGSWNVFTAAWLVAGLLMLILFFHLLQSAAISNRLGGATEFRPRQAEYLLLGPRREASGSERLQGEEGVGEKEQRRNGEDRAASSDGNAASGRHQGRSNRLRAAATFALTSQPSR